MKNTLEKIVTYLKEHRPVAICGGSILALVFVVCIIVAVISNSNKDSIVDAGIPSVNTESQDVAVNTPTTESEKNSVQTELPETNATESQKPVETQENQETQVPTETQETQVSNETQGTQVSSETQKQNSQKEPVKEPEKESEKKPVKEPEKEPEKKPEKKPVKEPEKEPEKKPEKEPEKESEKESEVVDTRKPWEIDFEGYKASCVEVTNREDFDSYKGFDEDLDFMEQYEILRMLNYDYPDGDKVFDHELCVITTRWFYNLAGEKILRSGYYTYKEIDAPWPVEEYSLDLYDLGLSDHKNDWGESCFLIKEYSQTEPTLAFAYYKQGR